MCRSSSLQVHVKPLGLGTKRPSLKAKLSHPPPIQTKRVHFADTPVAFYIEPSTFEDDHDKTMAATPDSEPEQPTTTVRNRWINRDDLRRSLFTKAWDTQKALADPKYTTALRDVVWSSSSQKDEDDDIQIQCNQDILDQYRGLERTCLVKLLQSKAAKKLHLFDPKEHPKLITKSVVRFQQHLKLFGNSDQGELLRIHYSRYTRPACKFASLIASTPDDTSETTPSRSKH